jgi:hypothetical protein
LTAEVERHKRSMIHMTLETERIWEELQSCKESPSPVQQRQIDQEKLQEEFQKLKTEYKIATDSLVYHTCNSRDLNRELLCLYRENEAVKHQMELMRIQHHNNLQEAQSTQQLSPVDQERMQ